MKERLDVDVPDDANGVLQDIHWSRRVWKSTSGSTYGRAMACRWALTPSSRRSLVKRHAIDAHWSFGAVGYFPSYTLGAIMAAQIFAAAEDAHDLEAQIRRGEFAPLRGGSAPRSTRSGAPMRLPTLRAVTATASTRRRSLTT